jgi:hypothetical protein
MQKRERERERERERTLAFVELFTLSLGDINRTCHIHHIIPTGNRPDIKEIIQVLIHHPQIHSHGYPPRLSYFTPCNMPQPRELN